MRGGHRDRVRHWVLQATARPLSLASTTATDNDIDAAGGSGRGKAAFVPLLSVTWRCDSARERGSGDDDDGVDTVNTTTHLEVAVAPVELQLDHLLLQQLLTVAYTAQRLLRISPVIPVVATSTIRLSTTPPPPPALSARVTAEELRVRKLRWPSVFYPSRWIHGFR
jgi:hypothetical protein